MVELRQLQYFVALSADGSFAKAAEGQHITQSALSQQIARLERELGVQLFERSVRGATLTAPGAELLEQARRVLDGVGDLRARAASLARESHGELRIGSPTYAVRSRARQHTVATFVARHPTVTIRFENAWSPQLLELLRAGSVDLSFAMLAPDDSGFEFVLVQSEPALLVVPEQHRLAGADRVGLDDLGGERVLLYPTSVNAWMFERMAPPLQERGAEVAELEEPSLPSVLEQVRAGAGLFPAIPWEMDFVNPAQLEGLAVLRTSGEEGLRYRMWLARRSGGATPVIEAFWACGRPVQAPGQAPGQEPGQP